MEYIRRDLEKKILSLVKEYSCILLTGPRQVGKTTVFKEIMEPERVYVTLDDLDERRLAREDPAMFLQMHDLPVFIDEVQYAPELFSYIKIAIDKGAPPSSFWLSGSQTFRLMELAQESLAGRVAVLQMSSLSQHELYGQRESSLRLKWELLRTERRTVFRLTWLKYMKGYGTVPCRGTGAEDTATAVYFIQAIFRPTLSVMSVIWPGG